MKVSHLVFIMIYTSSFVVSNNHTHTDVSNRGNWWKGSSFKTITPSEYWDRIGRHNYIVLDVYTPWCYYCRKYFNEFNTAVDAFKGTHAIRGDIEFYKINAEESDYLDTFLGALNLPSIIIIDPYSNKPEIYDGRFRHQYLIEYLKNLPKIKHTKLVKEYYEDGRFGKNSYLKHLHREEQKDEEERKLEREERHRKMLDKAQGGHDHH